MFIYAKFVGVGVCMSYMCIFIYTSVVLVSVCVCVCVCVFVCVCVCVRMCVQCNFTINRRLPRVFGLVNEYIRFCVHVRVFNTAVYPDIQMLALMRVCVYGYGCVCVSVVLMMEVCVCMCQW